MIDQLTVFLIIFLHLVDHIFIKRTNFLICFLQNLNLMNLANLSNKWILLVIQYLYDFKKFN